MNDTTIPAVVASSRAAHVGYCQHCDGRIGQGDPIFKVDLGDRGRQTAGGNGRGSWWCSPCTVELLQQQQTLDT